MTDGKKKQKEKLEEARKQGKKDGAAEAKKITQMIHNDRRVRDEKLEMVWKCVHDIHDLIKAKSMKWAVVDETLRTPRYEDCLTDNGDATITVSCDIFAW